MNSNPVTTANFARAESDRMFNGFVAVAGGLNRLHHSRLPTPLDQQTVIRVNRDTLYSAAVADLEGEPQLTIELTMIGAAEPRRIVRTADGVDVFLPFSWLSDVWMRGLAVTVGRLCIAAETTDGSSWTLDTLGPDLANVTQLTIAPR